VVLTYESYHSGIFSERLKKTLKILNNDICSHGYEETGVMTTTPRRSVAASDILYLWRVPDECEN
jgi:hypothetical protein